MAQLGRSQGGFEFAGSQPPTGFNLGSVSPELLRPLTQTQPAQDSAQDTAAPSRWQKLWQRSAQSPDSDEDVTQVPVDVAGVSDDVPLVEDTTSEPTHKVNVVKNDAPDEAYARVNLQVPTAPSAFPATTLPSATPQVARVVVTPQKASRPRSATGSVYTALSNGTFGDGEGAALAAMIGIAATPLFAACDVVDRAVTASRGGDVQRLDPQSPLLRARIEEVAAQAALDRMPPGIGETVVATHLVQGAGQAALDRYGEVAHRSSLSRSATVARTLFPGATSHAHNSRVLRRAQQAAGAGAAIVDGDWRGTTMATVRALGVDSLVDPATDSVFVPANHFVDALHTYVGEQPVQLVHTQTKGHGEAVVGVLPTEPPTLVHLTPTAQVDSAGVVRPQIRVEAVQYHGAETIGRGLTSLAARAGSTALGSVSDLHQIAARGPQALRDASHTLRQAP